MNTNQIAHIAALVGEPARTGMLLALMDGRALTARELADAAHITPATASRHLALLVQARLLSVQSQGRHRYHRLASAEVARLLEGLMQLAAGQASPARPVAVGPRDAALRRARTCYDHIAGRLGVAVAEHLLQEGAIVFDAEAGGQVTDRAAAVLGRLGLDLAGPSAGPPQRGPRPLCRPCLDWSERRPHLAGRLGALVCAHCLDQGWLVRREGSRALAITPPGAAALQGWLGTARWSGVVQAPLPGA
ncbi:helix-turn-helix transcriptional regulator [Acidovorax sp. SUPP1855]|uniref:ArsR/SmtB family transcription factor n=1 Tax=Acidovorax sp. SUPP1855 TaxID=431774 RepID=UPI0024E1153B|nr:helix-turn-helix transcriptional regulator [Acidovorax sp. SUPP1855]